MSDNVPGPVEVPDDAPEPELEIVPDIVDEGAPEAEEEELDEFEIEGRKLRVPKIVKELAEQGKDYRYKTGLTAAERRAAEAEKTRYSALVKAAEETIKAAQPARPDAAMLDRMSDKYDPDTYHLQRAQWESWAQKAYDAEQERKRIDSEEGTKAERERSERKAATERELVKAFPQWKDPAAKAADRAKLEAYVAAEGVGADEVGEIDVDHRIAKFAYKAMLYDQAVAKARAAKAGTEVQSHVVAAPVKRIGGGSTGSGGVPKTTEGYIAWRRKGGKM